MSKIEEIFEKNWKLFTFILGSILFSRFLLVIFSFFNCAITFENFLVLINRLDSKIYIDIASTGYNPLNAGWFPLFPLALKFSSFIIPTDLRFVALVINSIFLFFTCLFSYKYVLLTRANKEMAIASIILLTFGPWSYLSAATMAESLLMLLLIMSLYFLKKEYYIRMGICGALLSATKVFGVFFAIVVLVEIIQKYLKEEKNKSFINFVKYCVHKPKLIIGVFMIPIGLLAFMLYLQIAFNDALLFYHIQASGWGHRYVDYLKVLFVVSHIDLTILVLFALFISFYLIVNKKYSEAVLPIIVYLITGMSMLEGIPRYHFSCLTIMYGTLDIFYLRDKPNKIINRGLIIFLIFFEVILIYLYYNMRTI